MPEVTCALVEDLLDLYLDGETSEETVSLLEEHIDSCARCQSRIEQRRRARERLARLAWGKGELSSLLAGDAKVIAMARRRLRRTVLRVVALSLAVVVAGWAGVWFLSAPAPPGMYLARFTGSQILVNGRAGFIIPFLWVPEYPGQRPPELWTVEIPCVGGRGLTLKVAGVTLEGWTYGPLRYQRGWIHAYQQEGVLTRFGDGFWSFYPKEPPLDPLWDDEGLPYITRRARAVTIIARAGRILATTSDIDLTLVQWNDHSIPTYRPAPGPDGEWSPFFRVGIGASADGRHVHLQVSTDVEGVELVDVILPESVRLLRIEVSHGPGGVGLSEPLDLPYRLPVGTTDLVGQSVADPGFMVFATMVVLRVGGETHLEETGPYSTLSGNAPLGEVYDLRQPD